MEDPVEKQAETYDHWTEKQRQENSFSKVIVGSMDLKFQLKDRDVGKEAGRVPNTFLEVLCIENESIKKISLKIGHDQSKKIGRKVTYSVKN